MIARLPVSYKAATEVDAGEVVEGAVDTAVEAMAEAEAEATQGGELVVVVVVEPGEPVLPDLGGVGF